MTRQHYRRITGIDPATEEMLHSLLDGRATHKPPAVKPRREIQVIYIKGRHYQFKVAPITLPKLGKAETTA